MLKAKKSAKSGQAIIELVPVIFVLMILVFASLVFFQGIRESTRAQEAARNMAFATIANSGPLVSTGGSTQISGQYQFAGAANRPGINSGNICFGVKPQAGTVTTRLPSILGLGMDLTRVQKATVFRQPGSKNSCD